MIVKLAEEWRLNIAVSAGIIGKFENEWEVFDEDNRFAVEGAHCHRHRLQHVEAKKQIDLTTEE